MSDDSGGQWGVEGDSAPGEGWWRASDGRWYPPESAPGAAAGVPTPSVEPESPVPQVPTAAQPATMVPTPGGDGPSGGGSKLNPVLLIVVGVVVVGAIIAGIVIATSGGDDDEVDVADGSPTPTPTGEATPEASAEPTPTETVPQDPTATAEPTEDPSPATTPTSDPTPDPTPTREADRCRYLGIDSFGDMQIVLDVTSPVTAGTLLVGYVVLGPDGEVLDQSDVFVDLVVEGERLSLPTDTFTAAPAGAGVADITCEVGPIETVEPFFDELPFPPDADCRVAGLTEFDDVAVDLAFTSSAQAVLDATVIMGLYLDGARIATVTTFVDRLAPSEPVALAIETFEVLPPGVSPDDLECALLGVTDDDFEQEWSPPVASDTCIVTGADSFGDVQVELVVTNPFPEPIELDVLYAIRDPDGARVYSVYALTGSAEVGETIIVDHDSFSAVPADLSALDVSCEVLGILRF